MASFMAPSNFTRPVANSPNNLDPESVALEQEQPKQPEQPSPPKAQENPALNTSQQAWNHAFDDLANSESTADFVEEYLRIVPKATGSDGDASTGETGDAPAELNDPVQREVMMKRAVQKGQEKVFKSTAVTNAIGSFLSFVMKFKDVVDLAVGNIPRLLFKGLACVLGSR
ncbi:hypothetical protein BDW62DRAFT_202463 [Aspergillus aurantiobrunneus]